MSNRIINSQFFNKNIYLLVIAAWLVTLSFLINNYWSSYSSLQSVQKHTTRYVQHAEEDFARLLQNPDVIGLARSQGKNDRLRQDLLEENFFLFLYEKLPDSLGLHYWNTQTVLPDEGIIAAPGRAGFAELQNGFYVWNKIDSAGVYAIALIPVKWNYIVNNAYLKNIFVSNARTGLEYDIFPGPGEKGLVQSRYNVPLFHLVKKGSGAIVKDNVFSIWFRIAAALLVLLFIHLSAQYIVVKKRFLRGFFFLVSSIALLRAASYFLPLPLRLRQLELFDPTIYGSNFILRSLGDLLINAILFLWMVMFVRQHLHNKPLRVKLVEPYQRWVLLLLSTFILLTATFGSVYVIQSLVADSKISFDVINFFELNVYSVVGFIVLCCIAVGYYFLAELIIFFLRPFFSARFYELYLAVAVGGLLVLSFGMNVLNGGLAIWTLVWLLVFLHLLNTSYLNLLASRIVSSRLVFWIFFFSFSMTLIIVTENNEKELRNRYHYAEVLATKTNTGNESMLNSMLTDYRGNFLTDNYDRFRDSVQNRKLKDSLINNNSSGYNRRYDTRIYSFDAKDRALYNADKADYNQLNSILNTLSRETAVPGLFYYDESYDRFNYISKKVINDTTGRLLGTVFVVVSPRRVKSDMPYPDLFSRGAGTAIENSSTYAFAVYQNGRIVNSYNDYPFSTTLPAIKFGGDQYYLVKEKAYTELWYNAGVNKKIVIVKERRRLLETITLFSYFFCAFLVLNAVFWLLTVFINSRLNPQKLRNYSQLSIRNQIHGIIIFISVLSFIVIGVATILFFISRYENNNREKLSRAIQIMQTQVSNSLSDGLQLNDSLLLRDRPTAQGLEKNILNIAEIHGVDVNIYNLDGQLKFASLSYPYARGIVSTQMNPQAYYHLAVKKEIQFFQKESIGSLSYVSSYVPVFDKYGNDAAFLNIPYFSSEQKLEDEIANFLVTIINLNAFIFLMAGIVALFITNRITGSFSLIGEKMKKINLGKNNEPIQWNRNDEIGSLVNEYNRMLAKLDESAAALAKTEREGAWREMAKQVAHEIKNPLTPMKLSMQFLQRSIETNAPGVEALTASVVHTMVEQIDHLSNIASEFSQFANIENAHKELLDLHDVLLSIKTLYESNEDATLHWSMLEQPVMILADKTHVNRLFTNLVLNAMQSVPEGRQAQISISETLEESAVLIEVKDNGDGIPDDIQPKIFTPNFTTKSSGTGLGLAMCRRIVEQMGGTIWFETRQQQGTSFYVRIPLARD